MYSLFLLGQGQTIAFFQSIIQGYRYGAVKMITINDGSRLSTLKLRDQKGI